MKANGPTRSVVRVTHASPVRRWTRRGGFTLIEVAVSIAVVMALVMAGLGARYLTVKQAVRADAYNTAGRLAMLLMEGWRSTEPTLYNPTTTPGALQGLSPTVTITGGAANCPAPPDSSFTTLDTYLVTADNKNFYVTLSYKVPDPTPGAEHPAMLSVVVSFLDGYVTGNAAASHNRVSMTTYR